MSLFGSQSRCEYYTHSLTCSRYKAANLSFIFETRLCPACSRYKTVSLLLFHGYLSHLCGFVSYSALQDSVFSYLFCSAGLSFFLTFLLPSSYFHITPLLERSFETLLSSLISCLHLSLVFTYLLSSLISCLLLSLVFLSLISCLLLSLVFVPDIFSLLLSCQMFPLFPGTYEPSARLPRNPAEFCSARLRPQDAPVLSVRSVYFSVTAQRILMF